MKSAFMVAVPVVLLVCGQIGNQERAKAESVHYKETERFGLYCFLKFPAVTDQYQSIFIGVLVVLYRLCSSKKNFQQIAFTSKDQIVFEYSVANPIETNPRMSYTCICQL